MRPGTSTGPPQARVQRQFDPSRLAPDCQAHAYEQVLPVIRRSLVGSATPLPRELISQDTQGLEPGGQAA
jgi:hypothetical protein